MSERFKLKILNKDLQGEDVAILTLGYENNVALPTFEAGAHIDLYLPDGLVRQYSLCGSSSESNTWRLGILNDQKSRGGSRAVHLLSIGDEVEVGMPRNLFPLDKSAKYTYLFGGGIGITPMLAMADELQREGHEFELHYCGKSRKRMAFIEELSFSDYSKNVKFHFDDENDEQKLNLTTVFANAKENSHVYVCGPEGFMDWVILNANESKFSPENVHREYFNKELEISGKTFEVELPEQGISVKVKENQTIVGALAEVGIRVKVSCEQGICGTCLANVLDGTPDHRDSYLTDEEKADNDQIILCCSRSQSEKLVLEVFEIEQ